MVSKFLNGNRSVEIRKNFDSWSLYLYENHKMIQSFEVMSEEQAEQMAEAFVSSSTATSTKVLLNENNG